MAACDREAKPGVFDLVESRGLRGTEKLRRRPEGKELQRETRERGNRGVLDQRIVEPGARERFPIFFGEIAGFRCLRRPIASFHDFGDAKITPDDEGTAATGTREGADTGGGAATDTGGGAATNTGFAPGTGGGTLVRRDIAAGHHADVRTRGRLVERRAGAHRVAVH
jgi:hypothetical protein